MTVAPADHLPSVKPEQEFIAPPSDPDEERIEAGVAIVGGGPAGLSCAIRLSQLIAAEPRLAELLGEVPIAVLEKGPRPGAQLLSGAMMSPSALARLLPDVDPSEWPTYGPVDRDAVYLMTSRRALRLPTPPPFRNHGNHATSVARLGRWLAARAEAEGVVILSETAATKLLVADGVVRGVRTGDRGRGREGEPLANFQAGSELIARATVLAEGSQGHLTGAALRHFGIAGDDPQRWELGVKEVWRVAQPLDRVVHTIGWPLRARARYREFGGAWIYPMGEQKVSLGFVAGLDYRDARFSVHDVLQQLKTHPLVRGILAGGERLAWGAKTIPSGGYWAMPSKLWAPGLCIAGDGAGMVNVPRLKGLHYAMHAGMFAAEAIFDALKTGSADDLSSYQQRVEESLIEDELYRARNMRQPFRKGLVLGGAIAGAMQATGGRLPGGHWRSEDDAVVDVFIGKRARDYPKPDGKLTFDKLSSVFASGNVTRDDAPNHIRVRTRVPLELALLWQNMCPAQVYEVTAASTTGRDALVDVTLTPSNCIQCGAITAKGGRLTPAEGGDGPNYQET